MATVLLAGCLAPGSAKKMSSRTDLADPAAVYDEIAWGRAQVFVTNMTYFWVPTFTADVSGSSIGSFSDALPTLPAWVQPYPGNPTFVWAPTVRKIGSQWVLMFSGSRNNGSNCIGVATSSTAKGPYTPRQTQWCDGNPGIGYLDPEIFRDPSTGLNYLYWSKQSSENGGSEIVVQRLSADGLSRVGGVTRVVTWADVKPHAGNTGAHGYLENPSMVKDQYNGYDLLVSIGTWQESNYHTFEMPCLAVDGYCLPDRGANLPLTTSGSNGTGGASLISNGSPDGNQLFFAAHPTAGSLGRSLYLAPTSEYNGNPPVSSRSASAQAQARAAAVPPRQTSSLVVPKGWQPRSDRPGINAAARDAALAKGPLPQP